jgi:RNA polymerase-binding transcription factor DksA
LNSTAIVQNYFMAKSKAVRKKAVRPSATREDLLGFAKVKRVPPRWRDYHHKLLQARELLFRQQEALSRPEERARAGTGLHMADAGTDSFDQDMTLGILSADRDTLRQIDRALERIRNGTYGICELTGKKINAKRLEAIPWARFSTEAERQLEKEGLHRRARLPEHGVTALPPDFEAAEAEEAE